jgi:hypothetical protein
MAEQAARPMWWRKKSTQPATPSPVTFDARARKRTKPPPLSDMSGLLGLRPDRRTEATAQRERERRCTWTKTRDDSRHHLRIATTGREITSRIRFARKTLDREEQLRIQAEMAMSQSTTPVPSTEGAANQDAQRVPDAEAEAMQTILTFIYEYRDAEYVIDLIEGLDLTTRLTDFTAATIHPRCFSAKSTSAHCPHTTRSSRSPWP